MSLLPTKAVSISGCSEMDIIATPQVPFRVFYLYISEIIGVDFEITSIKIGRNEILSGIGDVYAPFFSLVSEERWGLIAERLRKRGSLDAMMDAMKLAQNEIARHDRPVIIRARNLNPCARNFRCTILGLEVEESPPPRSARPVIEPAKSVITGSVGYRQGTIFCYACGQNTVVIAGDLCPVCAR